MVSFIRIRVKNYAQSSASSLERNKLVNILRHSCPDRYTIVHREILKYGLIKISIIFLYIFIKHNKIAYFFIFVETLSIK